MQETLTLQVKEPSYLANLTIDTVDLWGLERKITNVMADGNLVPLQNIIYDGATKVRLLKLVDLKLHVKTKLFKSKFKTLFLESRIL